MYKSLDKHFIPALNYMVHLHSNDIFLSVSEVCVCLSNVWNFLVLTLQLRFKEKHGNDILQALVSNKIWDQNINDKHLSFLHTFCHNKERSINLYYC